jgi:L-fucose mutarotase/ribose pyranase (RbsD/FucU family)
LADSQQHNGPNWMARLNDCLPLFGHRNWIVVADSAYPAQSSPGIETIIAAESQIDVAQAVAGAIAASTHVKALVHLDRELAFVHEADAPGVQLYRSQLESTLHGAHVDRIPHDAIISMLDQSSQVFRVLIIKTPMTIPYTSVFFQLDCRYWTSDAEQRLRQAMQSH